MVALFTGNSQPPPRKNCYELNQNFNILVACEQAPSRLLALQVCHAKSLFIGQCFYGSESQLKSSLAFPKFWAWFSKSQFISKVWPRCLSDVTFMDKKYFPEDWKSLCLKNQAYERYYKVLNVQLSLIDLNNVKDGIQLVLTISELLVK